MKKVSLLFILILMTNMLFADPFGLKMGMTLQEIKEKCGGKEPEYGGLGVCYKIEPIKKDKVFVGYTAYVNDNIGLYGLWACTETEVGKDSEPVFNYICSALKSYYGKPSEVGEFSCIWDVGECEGLKKENLARIALRLEPVQLLGYSGYSQVSLL